ncbi:sulfotransferase [Gemmatimonadota bacterium]
MFGRPPQPPRGLNKMASGPAGTPLTFIKLVLKNRPISFSRIPIAVAYLIRACCLFPMHVIEMLFRSRSIRATSMPDAPIFIIGHYRSGTTLLHKLLLADNRWGHITVYDMLFPHSGKWGRKVLKPIIRKLIEVLKVKHLHFNNYLVDLDDPIEEDFYTIAQGAPLSGFWSEIFPRNSQTYVEQNILLTTPVQQERWKEAYVYLLKKITALCSGKQLLLKNPPNTPRVRFILDLFPDARFIFIYRNPYQVFYSTLFLWKRTLEKYYTLQNIHDAEREEMIFSLYSQIMTRLEEDRALIPPENIIDIRYEELKEDPHGQIRNIYKYFGLPGFHEVEADLISRIEEERAYEAYRYSYDDETQAEVYRNWGYFIDTWGYGKIQNP